MTRYLEQLNETTDPTTGDYLPIYDASAGSTDKDRKVNISRFAILANGNTFTTTQTFAPTATGVTGVAINMPASTTFAALALSYNSSLAFNFLAQAATRALQINGFDNGTGVGCNIQIGRNTQAGTPAAGHVVMYAYGGTYYSVWPDNGGLLRIGSATQPTNATDTSAGTVVGTQTSSLDSKDVIGEFTDYDGALEEIINTPVYDFTYKSGSFNGEKFTGIITDYSPVFGMDKDEAHPAGKSLNPTTGFGFTVAAFRALERRVKQLETNNG